MSKVAELAAAIDEFMGMPKRLHGASAPLTWQPGRQDGECRVKLPIEVGGELRSQSLSVLAYPRASPLQFTLALLFPPAIARLDFGEHLTHANNRALSSDDLPALVRGTHYHPWDKNKRFLTSLSSPLKLKNATGLPRVRKFDAALRWFCAETKIDLPANHTIDLPPRDVLL